MTKSTLTRAEAQALIDDAMSDLGGEDTGYGDLLELAKHWEKTAGFTPASAGWSDTKDWDAWAADNDVDDPEGLAGMLETFVSNCATGDDQRSNGPKDDDDTGLTAPDEEIDRSQDGENRLRLMERGLG